MSNNTSRDLMIATWRGLGEPRAGAKELRKIQHVFERESAAGEVPSPAAIARVLADEGAELIHPEVIECDARWRERELKKHAANFLGLEPLLIGEELILDQAEILISRAEELRQRFLSSNDRDAWSHLKAAVVRAREIADTNARRGIGKSKQNEQAEIAEWLKVWLQTPALFADWVELRKRTPEYKRRFKPESD